VKISELQDLLHKQLELFGDIKVEYCYGISAGIIQLSAQFDLVDLLADGPSQPAHTLVIGRDYFKGSKQRSVE